MKVCSLLEHASGHGIVRIFRNSISALVRITALRRATLGLQLPTTPHHLMRLLASLIVLAGLSLPALAQGEEVESMRVETKDKFVLKGDFWKPRKKGRAPAARR